MSLLTIDYDFSSLYGSNQIIFTPSNHTNERQLESVFIRALDTLGEISFIVHSSANEPLKVSRQELSGDVRRVNRKLDR